MDTETQYDYDLFVIGGGSGGLRAAKTAAKLGAKVAVADYVVPTPIGTTWGLGGTCVNVGCVPKKLFHFAANLGEAKADLKACGWQLDEKAPHQWEVMAEAVNKHIRQLRWNAKLVLTQIGVKYYNMLASLHDAHTVRLHDPKKNKEERATAKYILIAVGGRPNYPDDLPNAKEVCITSDDVFYLKKSPGKTLAIGGSYIALETAGFLNGVGLDVTVLVREKILRSYDQQMAAKVGEYMEKKGIKFNYGATLDHIEKLENGQKRAFIKQKDGTIKPEDFDTIFLAIGRTAETKYLNLDKAGVKQEEKSLKIYTNDHEQTNVPSIYAVGDVAVGRPELTPPAVLAGQLLSERLFGGSSELMNYRMVATTFFTPLEYGCIGYPEKDAIDEFGKEKISAYHTTFKPLEWTFNEDHPSEACYIKIVCRKDQNEKIIGLHFLGPNAGEVIQGFSLGINLGATRHDLFKTVGIHPTCAEELLSVDLTTDIEPSTAEGCKGCGL